eukprot:CAMPEP_0113866890 /NCGR_PEP_ID=MMETSP0780_2-20120614/120_1 /TAXON_ID=652834 /ORGANISM="Palpitomonas bilix" /LENGTH=182 /DNA_ID=CAMNT_0000851783 /DNA_START=60 /DNA_END=608 /DNA_ORIENTATION=+ /assembly_acc=CAM_ASM_000599
MDSMAGDCISIVGISIGSTLFVEALSWLLIYRTEKYQTLKANLERVSQQMERYDGVKDRTKLKKKETLEENQKEWSKAMQGMQMYSNIIIAIVMITMFSYLSSSYEARVVARLPFEPLGMFRGITHRGLPGEDYTECSFAFLYFLCSMSIRSVIKKAMGSEQVKGMASTTSMMGMPDPSKTS